MDFETCCFEKLLENDNLVPIHQKNLQLLVVEFYKTRNHLNPLIMMETFKGKGITISAKILEQSKSTKSENHILLRIYIKAHGPKSTGKITNRN